MIACDSESPSCARLLLKDSRVKVNEPVNGGYTPLCSLARQGHLDIIKWWIAFGREIDLGTPGDSSTDAIGEAEERRKTEVVTLLERFKENPVETRHVVRVELGLVDELAAEPRLTLLCGRYEGFDERILDHFATDRISIGRYVLAGGELAAMVVCDAILRKQPGALGHAESALEESFSAALEGAPEYPHYTRPAQYRGWEVPEILLSGHHANIREWRLEQARRRASG